MKLSIVIPLFNEVDNIPRLRDELLPVAEELATSNTVELIFVDDGSRDGTQQALERAFAGIESTNLRLHILRHPQNRGLGAALRLGFASSSGEVVVTIDSDGSYALGEIPALLSRLKPEVDIVTASPYHRQGKVEGVPFYRLLLSRGCSLLYRVLVDWHIHTYTSLFRAYRQAVVRHVNFTCDDHQAVTEILVNALLLGCRVAEHPTVLRRRWLGVSKANLARTVRDHLKFQANVLLHRVTMKPLAELALSEKAAR